MNVAAVGEVGLKGWKGKLADRVAPPVAERTRLTADQVRALIGMVFILLTLLSTLRLVRRVVQEART
jgi:hypothetical protein